jgi:hypothetical protein
MPAPHPTASNVLVLMYTVYTILMVNGGFDWSS